nr:hypothetical protein [Tanacetum cinerariifolium]
KNDDPYFTKLIIANIMKKFPSIPSRLEEDYHSIKDEILLEIRATDDYKEYDLMFVNVVIPMNQPQPVVSTQGMHRSTPKAHKTPTLTTFSPQGKKRKQSAGETSSPQKSLKVTIKQKIVVKGVKDKESYADKFAAFMIHNDDDNSRDKIKPESHKEHPKVIDNDDNHEEKKDDEMDPDKKRRISSKYSHLPGVLHRMCRRQGYMIRATNDLIVGNFKRVVADTVIQERDRDKIKPESHKEHLKVIDNDDNHEEKKDDEMGSLENRTEKM